MTRKKEQDTGLKQRLFNMEAAADYMGVSRSTFLRLYKHGPEPLPTVTIRARQMYDVQDMDRIIDEQKKKENTLPAVSRPVGKTAKHV